jgi:hypothetical protein
LRLAHEEPVIANSRCGSLELLIDRDRLRLFVFSGSEQGRRALKLVRASGCRELSVGINSRRIAQGRDGAGRLVVFVAEADIVEVSAVPEGACPGCTLRLVK